MPRRNRLNLTDVPQHVIQRGNNRQATFFAEEDYRFYLDCLVDAARKYDCQVYAYVLMTNHVGRKLRSHTQIPHGRSFRLSPCAPGHIGIPIGETMARCYTVIGFDSR
jgi:hypothetical protein